jgi:hypothetical protein
MRYYFVFSVIFVFFGCSSTNEVVQQAKQPESIYHHMITNVDSPNGRKIAVLGLQSRAALLNTGGQPVAGSFDQHRQLLELAIEKTIWQMFAEKGFATEKPDRDLSDISRLESENIYLLGKTDLTLSVRKDIGITQCERLYCEEKGQIKLDGQLEVKLIEPLSRQIFSSQRLNLADMNIAQDYLIQYPLETSSSMFGKAMDSMSSLPDQFIDNSEQALKLVLHEFYRQAMTTLDANISSEEILNLEYDIYQAKEHEPAYAQDNSNEF